MIRGFTNGCFRLIHRGHVEFLQECRFYCDWLTVGLNSDYSVRMLKGTSLMVEEDRKIILESIKWVDEVIIFNDKTPYKLIESIRPDIIFKGGDYKQEDVIGNDIAPVHIIPYRNGYSTSSIVSRIREYK